MTTSIRGQLLVDGAWIKGSVEVEGDRIHAVTSGTLVDDGRREGEAWIVPGLIDLHVHGYGGCDPLTDLSGMSRRLARLGTTACCPTLFPHGAEPMGEDVQRAQAAAAALDTRGTATGESTQRAGTGRILGLHLEGPFVNPKSAGALPPAFLIDPDPRAWRAIAGDDPRERGIRIVTVAPELAGADELIAELVRSGVRVSLGHSRATAAQARTAARAGADGATHLFNAMSGIHHRDPGLAAFALSDDALYAELIGDLVHVGREAIEIALRARGPEGLCLISDALADAGTGCDVFESHGMRCMEHAGAMWIADEEDRPVRLAGAAACQLEAVRRLVTGGVVDAADAFRMATETPARALGVEDELGRISAGAQADLLAIDPRTFELLGVWIRGKPVELS